jgi:hypothetical protein
MGAEAWTAGEHRPVEPACHQDARNLLHAQGHLTQRIIRVYPDAVLYLNPASKPMTAWLGLRGEKPVVLSTEPGFVALAA